MWLSKSIVYQNIWFISLSYIKHLNMSMYFSSAALSGTC